MSELKVHKVCANFTITAKQNLKEKNELQANTLTVIAEVGLLLQSCMRFLVASLQYEDGDVLELEFYANRSPELSKILKTTFFKLRVSIE